ncbi:hypothetical protein U1872_21775 [Sphingomonas sp. RB3P16]
MPPTGAKGLDIAASDISYRSYALITYYRNGDETGLFGYRDKALARIWKAERFSWYQTELMHRSPKDGAFEHRMQRAELDYFASSVAMQTAIAGDNVWFLQSHIADQSAGSARAKCSMTGVTNAASIAP